jgi:hypothetical protein
MDIVDRGRQRVEADEEQTGIKRLKPFIGEWSIEAEFPGAPVPSEDSGARTVFEWMSGGRFLVQRWQVPVPEAPDGIAIIGPDPERDGYLQHYFDSRGVARVYEMGFAEGVWKLSRTKADHSPLDFCQRFEGSFDDGGRTIAGRWEISHDGSSWEHDFNLTYRKLS